MQVHAAPFKIQINSTSFNVCVPDIRRTNRTMIHLYQTVNRNPRKKIAVVQIICLIHAKDLHFTYTLYQAMNPFIEINLSFQHFQYNK